VLRFFWVDGRLGWPPVIAVVFVTVSALVLDYVWRMFVIPSDRLIMYAVIIEVMLAIALIFVHRALGRRPNR
jgi:hypothetical protein